MNPNPPPLAGASFRGTGAEPFAPRGPAAHQDPSARCAGAMDGAHAMPIRRRLTAADAEALAALRLAVVADSPRGMGLTLAEEQLRSLDGFRAQLRGKPPSGVFGIFIAGELAAAAGILWPTVYPSGAHKAVLWGVFTAPSARRRGFARALAAHAAVHAFDHGARRVYLSVYMPNPQATRLYETLGFVATGREPEALRLGDEYFDIQYMSLAARDASPALAAYASAPLGP